MMNEEEIIELINSIPLDLRAEIVIADIISSGFDATEIFVRPVGLFERRFQKDILGVQVMDLTSHQKAIVVNASREGLYDMLPQTIMHNPPGKGASAFKSVGDMVDDYKRRIAEEMEARTFFMIYEIEFYKQRIANAIHEQHISEAISYSMNDEEILSYWRLPALFDKRQKGILFYLFPLFHRIRGSVKYMMEVYELILRQKVLITRTDNLKLLHFNNDKVRLGSIALSRDSVLGNSFQYHYPSFKITVQQLAKEHFYDFLPASTNWKIIEKLNDYFVPVFCESEIEIEKKKTAWRLDPNQKNESRLGYSSVV